MIPIAYRRDIRHGRILLGAFFLLGQVALVGPIAKRICTNEGFRSIHKLCIHILFLSLSSSPVLLRRSTRACRCRPYLSSCCTTRPRRGVGLRASMHAEMPAPRPWWLYCQSCTRRAINPPTGRRRRQRRSSHRTAETTTATAPPECPDAVMVGLVKTSLPPVRHTFSFHDLDVSSNLAAKGTKATHPRREEKPHPHLLLALWHGGRHSTRLGKHNPAHHSTSILPTYLTLPSTLSRATRELQSPTHHKS